MIVLQVILLESHYPDKYSAPRAERKELRRVGDRGDARVMGPPAYGYGYPGAPPPMPAATRPAVWTWYVIYVVLLAFVYLLCVGGGAALLALGENDEQRVQGIILSVVGLPFMLVYAVAPFLPKRPWAWVFHLVLICLTMSSACCIPAAIPLLIFWLKPEAKAFFGRT